MTQSPNDDRQGVTLALVSAGQSFTRHVLKIDPGNPALTREQMERYKTSVGVAAAFLFGGYHTLVHNFKSI